MSRVWQWLGPIALAFVANVVAGEALVDNGTLKAMLEVPLGSRIGQCRAVPVQLGPGSRPAFLAITCADATVDPWSEMFFYPTDTLKLALCDAEGKILWRLDLGKGVVPGMWFCPFFAFDLDGDGTDEIYFVNNIDADHPLGHRGRRLERLDARTGKSTGRWPWPARNSDESMSHAYRNFILGGHARDEAVLVTVQGTYQSMHLQAWSRDMKPRWERTIAANAPGARGSHMCPIADLDGDGVQEVMWGERCIELDTGKEVFCADRMAYRGHSDVVQPFTDPRTGQWLLYTCRESDPKATPRVVVFDAKGNRVWGAVDEGHMDMGWIARLGDGGAPVAMAIRIGSKGAGPGGTTRTGVHEFVFSAVTGEKLDLGFSVYRTLPVDLDGDGLHELVRTTDDGSVEVIDHKGKRLADLGADGHVAMACKLLDLPGEQLLVAYPDGTLRVWADPKAKDSDAALARYRHPLYRANRRLFATGYNLNVLGGL
ncbi:MAG TPA: polysaccharide lyase 11 [Planctomycetota bacterium]|nr:polysaccharide lyase 11 [Planctomycetota bacterium]